MKDRLIELLSLYEKEFALYNKKSHFYVLIRTFLLILFIVLIIAGMKIPAISSYFMILFILLLVCFIAVCIRHHVIKIIKDNKQLSIEVIQQYFKRIHNTWHDFKDTGEDLLTTSHMLLDLDIVGKNSLFQYLNIAKSYGGRKRLLERLSNIRLDSLLEDQKAVLELRDKIEFVVQFQVLSHNMKGNLTEEIQKINIKTNKHTVILFINSILSLITLTLGILCLFYILDSAYFTLSALIQLTYSLIIDKVYNKEFEVIQSTSKSFAYIYPLYKMISKEMFYSYKMISIKESINKGIVVMEELNKIYDFNTFRNHFLGYILSNSILPLNSYLLYRFHKTTTLSFQNLSKSITGFEDLESLISLSVLGVCKDHVSMPILNDDIELEIKDIKHPLLKENECIANSFSCGNYINIITGSNMSGKTSFMRTIALNMILMNAGGFVNGKMFKAPYLKIFTSMRVSDDIDKGISTFYGELLRIKDIIEYKKSNESFIVFIDEIFKGTNYNDRIFGAKEVIKQLSVDNSILFITTHDFELCDIEAHKIKNYYFEEYYENNQIKFDYKIKEGKCKTTNARFLMKQLEIIE